MRYILTIQPKGDYEPFTVDGLTYYEKGGIHYIAGQSFPDEIVADVDIIEEEVEKPRSVTEILQADYDYYKDVL